MTTDQLRANLILTGFRYIKKHEDYCRQNTPKRGVTTTVHINKTNAYPRIEEQGAFPRRRLSHGRSMRPWPATYRFLKYPLEEANQRVWDHIRDSLETDYDKKRA